jgi:hypothetical protein
LLSGGGGGASAAALEKIGTVLRDAVFARFRQIS